MPEVSLHAVALYSITNAHVQVGELKRLMHAIADRKQSIAQRCLLTPGVRRYAQVAEYTTLRTLVSFSKGAMLL